jgi:hypothetical protein
MHFPDDPTIDEADQLAFQVHREFLNEFGLEVFGELLRFK